MSLRSIQVPAEYRGDYMTIPKPATLLQQFNDGFLLT